MLYAIVNSFEGRGEIQVFPDFKNDTPYDHLIAFMGWKKLSTSIIYPYRIKKEVEKNASFHFIIDYY